MTTDELAAAVERLNEALRAFPKDALQEQPAGLQLRYLRLYIRAANLQMDLYKLVEALRRKASR